MSTAWRRQAIVGALVQSVACLAALPASAQTRPPNTLAFVVGIEKYDDAELDRLQYAADDARKVFEQLKVVSDLDPASTLLVADDEKAGSRVDAELLRTELQKFVQRIRDDTAVIVYLGGHGTLSPSRTLWYLPTNYSRKERTGYISFTDIRNMFKDAIGGELLKGVTVTFLVNMCGAGNAVAGDRTDMAVDDNRELIENARKTFQEQSFGFKRYAIIPATPREQNTFENTTLGASVFGHHLLDGLSGRAAVEGVITAGSLFKYLAEKLGEDLPQNDNFSGDIALGVTRKLEAASAYLVGAALVAVAQALESAGADRERSDQRRAVLDLAADRLGRVGAQASDLGLRAALRRAQIDALRNQRPSGAPVTGPTGATPDPVEAEQLAKLTGPAATAGLPTLRALRDQLQAGEPFYGLVIDSSLDSRAATTHSGAVAWQKVLSAFPGCRQVETTHMLARLMGGLPPGVPETIQRWSTAAAGAPVRLVVVYVGLAGLARDEARSTPVVPGPSRGVIADGANARLAPFGKAEIDAVIKDWPGPVTVGFLAPFGGVLLASGPPPRDNVSLLVAATERNGMAFASPGPGGTSTAALLAAALQEGAEDVASYGPLAVFLRTMSSAIKGTEWVMGTPGWFPNWGGPGHTTAVQGQVAPFRRFALHVAAGCALKQLDACDAKSRAPLAAGVADAPTATADPFDLLVAAARDDISNQPEAAAKGYAAAARALRATPSGPPAGDGVVNARAALQAVAGAIDRRARGVEKRVTRRVIVVRLGVEDYSSPLVADLPGTLQDLAAYGAALKKALERPGAPVTLRDVRVPATAEEILKTLETERDGLGADDLLVFVYSGRGAEIEGRRYLTAAGAKPCDEPVGTNRTVTPTCTLEWTELVDLWRIADLMRDRWFIGIYDAQFTRPGADDRVNALLDKHLDSVRRASEEAESDPAVAATTASKAEQDARRFVALPTGRLPPRQLHVWVEGGLTAAYPPIGCAAPELGRFTSPLAAAIVSELPAKNPGTYGEWLTRVSESRCLETDDDDRHVQIVAQGSVGLPLFATGEAAELVDYFRSDGARRDANVRAADGVAAAVLGHFATDRNRLARAAILLSLAGLHSRGAELAAVQDSQASLREAEVLLQQVRLVDEDPDNDALRPIGVELRVRRHVLTGDPAQARSELRAAPRAVLSERGLAERLVALTEEAARRQPATLLEETSGLLEDAASALSARGGAASTNPLASARAQLAALIRTERSLRLLTSFTIEPPAAVPDR